MTRKNYNYRAFGFSISSELPIPELISETENKQSAEIKIILDNNIEKFASIFSNKILYTTHDNEVLFKFRDVLIISVKNGNQITVTPLKNFEEDVARLVILGSGFGALLMQRKILPLHGSAIIINGKVYAIVGDSGVGKSTLASCFSKKGYKVLTDDVIPVTFDSNNVPYILSTYPQQKLWEQSLKEFGMDVEKFQPLFQRQTKYAVPISSSFSEQKLPLVGLFELAINNNEFIQIKPYKGLERLEIIYKHTYRNFLINKLNLKEWHFKQSTKILNHVNLYKLRRPNGHFSGYNLVEQILIEIGGAHQYANRIVHT